MRLIKRLRRNNFCVRRQYNLQLWFYVTDKSMSSETICFVLFISYAVLANAYQKYSMLIKYLFKLSCRLPHHHLGADDGVDDGKQTERENKLHKQLFLLLRIWCDEFDVKVMPSFVSYREHIHTHSWDCVYLHGVNSFHLRRNPN